MPLETLNHLPPPLFKQGPSALSRLAVLSALALFLMVADARFNMVQPLRTAIATALYPAQWLALRPVRLGQTVSGYLTDLKTARKTEAAARARLAEQSQRAGQVEQLLLENRRLRGLLALRDRIEVGAQAAQVLYDATDPYSRRVVIGKGQLQGVETGSPVMDEAGLLGQVTRVYPFVSEITLLVDLEQVTPVINTRTGTRAVLYGSASPRGDLLELRYVSLDEDLQAGDLLVTSGVGGVYPPGLPVARVGEIQAGTHSGFTRALCQPLAQLRGVTHVMVLTPLPDPAADNRDRGEMPPGSPGHGGAANAASDVAGAPA